MAVPLDPALVAPRDRRPDEAQAERLDDGLYALRLPLTYRYTRSVNGFLLRTADGWTLVDCGSAIGEGWEALLHALRLARVEPHAITTLLLTHLHADHASLAQTLVERLGCGVWRLEGPDVSFDLLREPALPDDDRRARARAEGVPAADLDALMNSAPAGDGRQPRPEPSRLLLPDDVVAGGGGEWRVLAAPGHSAQQLMLFDARHGRLIAADAVYSSIRPYLEWGHTPDPVAEYAASLDRADALAAELLLPAHGRPDRRPAERIASARAALQRAVDRVAAEVGDEPRTAYDVTCRIAGDRADPDLRGAWLSVCLCVLEHFERRGAVAGERQADGHRRFRRVGEIQSSVW